MVNNSEFTNAIAVELRYLPNKNENSYYKVYKDANITRQIRVSNHGTYLRTWIDKNYDPSISSNISIAFTSNGVPTNDCLIDPQTNEPFKDCAPCIDHQNQSQILCKPRQVTGISNKKRKFYVTQFVYNCQYLTSHDVQLLVNAIKQASLTGEYKDPFANNIEKRAKSVILEPIEPIKDSIMPQHNIINEYDKNVSSNNKKIIRLTEREFHNIIIEAINHALNELV